MKRKIEKLVRFITKDIWKVSETELSPFRCFLYAVLKRVILASQNFIRDNISSQASALAYSTILSTVPILAIVFAIGRGFGYEALIEERIKKSLTMNTDFANMIFDFINSYLEHTQSGIFIGVGIVLLFYTIIQLVSNIENAFNSIWQIQKPRSVYRRITDYISIFFLLPIIIVLSSGLSIFMATIAKDLPNFLVLSTTVRLLISASPYILSGLAFTALYVFMPNTSVRFQSCIIPGFLAGIAFQYLQYFYIHSQIWVSSYNAIYGSFAALPMFMLWIQISWFICLFGAELSYANQNVENFNFAKDIRTVSRRYHDYLAILVLSKICKRFEKGEKPLSAHKVAIENSLPIRLVNEILYELCCLNLTLEISDDKGGPTLYVPAIDIHNLTLGLLLSKIDHNGKEYLNPDQISSNKEWEELTKIRSQYLNTAQSVLLKDI